MTKEQEAFRVFFEQVFDDHQQEILGTVDWIARHMPTFQYQYPKAYLAFKSLTTKEINQVICEVLLPF